MRLSSQVVGAAASSTSSSGGLPEPPAASSGVYKLDVELKRGHNLAVRDRGGALLPRLSVCSCSLVLMDL